MKKEIPSNNPKNHVVIAPNTSTYSDLVAGYVSIDFVQSTKTFGLTTSDGRDFTVELGANAYAEIIHNLGEKYIDGGAALETKLTSGRHLQVHGIFYPDAAGASGAGGSRKIEAKHLVFFGEGKNDYRFEEPNWWVNQIRQLADFYLDHEFGDKIDYHAYRTNLDISGNKSTSGLQETDTISRLVYGFASAYLMTGEDRYLEAAEKGTEFLRNELRYDDADRTYWYHAQEVNEDGSVRKILASEFADDYGAIPCYEQIYALAGPVQTMRITGDQRILDDAKNTIQMFKDRYRDATEFGGYFSHLDPSSFIPDAETLAHNQSRKNWNSIGDHAPAYLINLYLATGDEAYADFLAENFDLITEHFGDYENSPFVQERFHQDWSKDQNWGWQQNRAVIGHNLKIAWNLTRMTNLRQNEQYEQFAERIAELMPDAGSDQQRGGWYDVVERELAEGEDYHRFAWHDRKAWWQQEQGILAYLILAGVTGNQDYLRLARESSAFYNAWFLDNDSGGVYFNVLANGHPYALGTERGKSSHSMSGYHAFELAYLACTYTNLLITKQPMDMFFKPRAEQVATGVLRVAPDLLPAGSVVIDKVWIGGAVHENFDAVGLTVQLLAGDADQKVRVRLIPADGVAE
ncbi:MAG: AGE family epimerase/isomerase [Verrucomicrobiae bacterium]|nr:AGE family epimerase/isomerase [Verrucomicrobiae bacterium]